MGRKESINMAPSAPMDNCADGHLANAVLRSQRALKNFRRGVSVADGSHIRRSQFCLPMRLPTGRSVSALVLTISDIVRHSSQPKMFGVAARRVVARVGNAERRRKGGTAKHVGNSMSGVCVCLDTNTAISISVAGPSPWPAFAQRAPANLRPESSNLLWVQLWQGTVFRGHDALLGRASWSERRRSSMTARRSFYYPRPTELYKVKLKGNSRGSNPEINPATK